MAQRNFTPVNQIRLTNVAIVKYKNGTACFPVAWQAPDPGLGLGVDVLDICPQGLVAWHAPLCRHTHRSPNVHALAATCSLSLVCPGGKRFELACFKNKVMAWRSKAYVSRWLPVRDPTNPCVARQTCSNLLCIPRRC